MLSAGVALHAELTGPPRRLAPERALHLVNALLVPQVRVFFRPLPPRPLAWPSTDAAWRLFFRPFETPGQLSSLPPCRSLPRGSRSSWARMAGRRWGRGARGARCGRQ